MTEDEDRNNESPNGTGVRDANFALLNGVGIYGGFSGDETLNIQRNPVLHETILSGEIDEGGNDDSFHVVTAIEVNETAILAGFTISDGNATDASFPNNAGGGMYVDAAGPTVMDCNFSDNIALSTGGGMYICNSSNFRLF